MAAECPTHAAVILSEAEAARIAYMMREQHIGDPGYVNVDVARILTPEFAEEYGSKIRIALQSVIQNVKWCIRSVACEVIVHYII